MAGFMPPASPPLVRTAMLEGPVAEGAVAVSVMKQVKDPGPVRSTNPTVTTFGTSGTPSRAALRPAGAPARIRQSGRADKASAGESGGRPELGRSSDVRPGRAADVALLPAPSALTVRAASGFRRSFQLWNPSRHSSAGAVTDKAGQLVPSHALAVLGGRGVGVHGVRASEISRSWPGASSTVWSWTRTWMGWAPPGRELSRR